VENPRGGIRGCGYADPNGGHCDQHRECLDHDPSPSPAPSARLLSAALMIRNAVATRNSA
jgi:hypothetical protein